MGPFFLSSALVLHLGHRPVLQAHPFNGAPPWLKKREHPQGPPGWSVCVSSPLHTEFFLQPERNTSLQPTELSCLWQLPPPLLPLMLEIILSPLLTPASCHPWTHPPISSFACMSAMAVDLSPSCYWLELYRFQWKASAKFTGPCEL